MEIESRVTQITVFPKESTIFCEDALHVAIDYEAAGEFVVLKSYADDCGQIRINKEEWPVLREVIDKMISECKAVRHPAHVAVQDTGRA